ncbi:hypothetical protein BC828DRAFT_409235 [Blastocladiella britannica]|nr:hypothetical protein BC828DRAFT_409235 [Blastocladiella britannica]
MTDLQRRSSTSPASTSISMSRRTSFSAAPALGKIIELESDQHSEILMSFDTQVPTVTTAVVLPIAPLISHVPLDPTAGLHARGHARLPQAHSLVMEPVAHDLHRPEHMSDGDWPAPVATPPVVQSEADTVVNLDSAPRQKSQESDKKVVVPAGTPLLPPLPKPAPAQMSFRMIVSHDPKHWFWKTYDYLLRCLDFSQLFLLPILLAYVCDVGTNLVPYFVCCDIIYCASMVLDFHRPRRDRFGQLVVKRVAKRQLHLADLATKFEFLALLPLDWAILVGTYANGSSETALMCANPVSVVVADESEMNNGGGVLLVRSMYNTRDIPWTLQLYACTRLIRLLRIYTTVAWAVALKVPKVSEPISRLLKTLAFTVVFSHVDSSLFWALSIRVHGRDRWVDRGKLLVDQDGIARSLHDRYLRNLTSAEKALFFLPRDVDTFPEILYQFFEMLCAAVVYGSIFGNMASVIRSLDSRAGLDKAGKARNFKKTHLQKYMKRFKFPPALQVKVLEHEEFEWSHKKGIDSDDLFKGLPQSIREQVNYHLYYDLISSVPLFKELADEVIKRAMCEKITILNIAPHFYICKAGDHGTEMYFLRQGQVDVLNAEESKVLVTLGPGAFFGEVALFSNSLRTATIKSKDAVQLCVLKKKEFDEILEEYTVLAHAFKAQVEKRLAADRERAAAAAAEVAAAKVQPPPPPRDGGDIVGNGSVFATLGRRFRQRSGDPKTGPVIKSRRASTGDDGVPVAAVGVPVVEVTPRLRTSLSSPMTMGQGPLPPPFVRRSNGDRAGLITTVGRVLGVGSRRESGVQPA